MFEPLDEPHASRRLRRARFSARDDAEPALRRAGCVLCRSRRCRPRGVVVAARRADRPFGGLAAGRTDGAGRIARQLQRERLALCIVQRPAGAAHVLGGGEPGRACRPDIGAHGGDPERCAVDQRCLRGCRDGAPSSSRREGHGRVVALGTLLPGACLARAGRGRGRRADGRASAALARRRRAHRARGDRLSVGDRLGRPHTVDRFERRRG